MQTRNMKKLTLSIGNSNGLFHRPHLRMGRREDHGATIASVVFGFSLLLSSLLSLMLATEVVADVYSIEKTTEEIAEVDGQIESERQAALPLLTRLKFMKEVFDAEHRRITTMKEQSDGHVASFNSACANRPKNAGCESWGSKVKDEVREVELANAALTRKNQELTKMYNDVNLAGAHIQKLRNYRSSLQSSLLKALERDVAQTACSAARSPEEMKLKCGNVQSDGASIGLPACTTERCRQYDQLR